MLRLEGFMELQKLHHDGLSVREIARQVDALRAHLLERWKLGSERSSAVSEDSEARLDRPGHSVDGILAPWWSEGQEQAFVRFGTAPGEQALMDCSLGFGSRAAVGFALPVLVTMQT